MDIKKIVKTLLGLLFLTSFFGCVKPCDDSLRIGEIVQIPVQFVGFSLSEINNIIVYRVDYSDTNSIDTLLMHQILWANETRSTNEIITDQVHSNAQLNYGDYESYFDNCTLILDWNTGKDTLSDFEIKKSREKIEGCHKDDPNIKIDKISFVHKSKIISKNESIIISK